VIHHRSRQTRQQADAHDPVTCSQAMLVGMAGARRKTSATPLF